MNDDDNGRTAPPPDDDAEFGMSPSIAKIATALAKAQGEMSAAIKDSKNPHFNSSFANLASVMDACRQPLAANGLSYVQPSTASSNGVKVRTMLMHTSGEYIWSVLSVPLQKRDAQGVGSALTYARRYSLSSMVGISQDDDDGNGASGGGGRYGGGGGYDSGGRQEPRSRDDYQQPQEKQQRERPGNDIDDKVREIAKKKRAGGGKSSQTLLGFMADVDAADLENIEEVSLAWAERLADVPQRGRDRALAYHSVKRSQLEGDEPNSDDVKLASDLESIRPST